MTEAQKLLAVVGPTAVGKSALAVRLASELGGEVVSADSRQVYRYMDIGTAKPPAKQRSAVPHHLIDVADPDEEYSLAIFLRQSRAALKDIQTRSKLPVLAGGSGQYVWGLLEGWEVPVVPPNPGLRQKLEARAYVKGGATLHGELAALDPDAASRIDPRNARRVIRALEVRYASPDAVRSQPSRRQPCFAPVIIGLTLERADLHDRTSSRVDRMIEDGWVDEVRQLLGRGYRRELPSLSSLGYAELVRHVSGELPLEDAVEQTKRRTRKLVRHQRTWFKPSDERIRWFHASPQGTGAVVAWAREAVG